MANKQQFIEMILDLHAKGSLYITDEGMTEFGKLIREEFDNSWETARENAI